MRFDLGELNEIIIKGNITEANMKKAKEEWEKLDEVEHYSKNALDSLREAHNKYNDMVEINTLQQAESRKAKEDILKLREQLDELQDELEGLSSGKRG